MAVRRKTDDLNFWDDVSTQNSWNICEHCCGHYLNGVSERPWIQNILCKLHIVMVWHQSVFVCVLSCRSLFLQRTSCINSITSNLSTNFMRFLFEFLWKRTHAVRTIEQTLISLVWFSHMATWNPSSVNCWSHCGILAIPSYAYHLLTIVNSLMSFEIAFFSKIIITMITFKWFDTSVD